MPKALWTQTASARSSGSRAVAMICIVSLKTGRHLGIGQLGLQLVNLGVGCLQLGAQLQLDIADRLIDGRLRLSSNDTHKIGGQE